MGLAAEGIVAHREVGKESAHPAGPPLISAMAAVRAARRPGSAWHRQLPPQEHTSWLLLLMWVPVEHWLAFMPVHLGSLGEWASHRPTLSHWGMSTGWIRGYLLSLGIHDAILLSHKKE